MSGSSQFPSGEWTGYYVYSGSSRRHSMDLILEFRRGVISGEGTDDIGPFVIAGRYSESTLECSWAKTYVGRHTVKYTGFREGKGIWGTWDMPSIKGGFQIWPIGNQTLTKVQEEEATGSLPLKTKTSKRKLAGAR
jgi:hypothetical protein